MNADVTLKISRQWPVMHFVLAALIVGLALILYPQVAHADTYTVTNTLDDGSAGSFRWAMDQANTRTGYDAIVFDTSVFNVARTIVITHGTGIEGNGFPAIIDDLTIDGPATVPLTVSGSNLYRVFNVGSNSVGPVVTMTNLIIANGYLNSSVGGAAIRNFGALKLISTTVTNNVAFYYGGGIAQLGLGSVLILENTKVISNSAPTTAACGGSCNGGGIASAGIVIMTNSTIMSNTASGNGGGISSSGTLVITNSVIMSNTAAGDGGGINNQNNPPFTIGTITLDNVLVAGNTASGNGSGIYNNGVVTPTGAITVSNDIYQNTDSSFNGGADPIDLNGSLILAGGGFTSTSGSLSISGYLTHTGGTFNSNGGTVILNGAQEQGISTAAVITFANLVVTNTAGVVIPATHTPAVTGTMTNTGKLKQTRDLTSVNTPYTFLNISTDKYYGVVITPTGGAMGTTVVTILANPNYVPAGSVGRRFDITPLTPTTATVQLYYRDAESNANTSPNAYHWNGSGWDQLTSSAGGSGDAKWVEATNVASYSSFVLKDTTPTAVTLERFVASAWGETRERGVNEMLIGAALFFLGSGTVTLARRGRPWAQV